MLQDKINMTVIFSLAILQYFHDTVLIAHFFFYMYYFVRHLFVQVNLGAVFEHVN